MDHSFTLKLRPQFNLIFQDIVMQYREAKTWNKSIGFITANKSKNGHYSSNE